MNICFVSSEVMPFSKTGGLADVSGALGKFLNHNGHDVRMFTPFYDVLRPTGQEFYPVEFMQNIPLEFGGFTINFSVVTTKLPGSNTDVYFIHCPGLYNRGKIYTNDSDEYLRYAVLTRAAIECCQRMGWSPHIMHCNDWQTGLMPVYLKSLYAWDSLFHRTKTVLTIHNIGYQGVFSADVVEKLNLSSHAHLFPKEDLAAGLVNYLKTGLLHSDLLTTVSQTYAREIQTPEYGAGLDGILRMRSGRCAGLRNRIAFDGTERIRAAA